MENTTENNNIWKRHATRLILILESLAEHNKLLLQCIRDIDAKMYRDVKTKLREFPLDKHKQ
jgi:hypothetical protein|tara:strand:+ start:925 stop:1110 length:186 start_codon:yes stop_codon:yes gene_type:complete